MFESLSQWLINLGLRIVPLSGIAFFPLKLFEYSFDSKSHLSRLVKSIWYLSMGLLYLQDIVGVDVVVTTVCFIECFDLFFQFLEGIKHQNRKL
ncbi:hypothetical protein [Methanosarcina mazei]|uniref:Uncharacterized protein n=1 Tax=Methanosarcina mazei TaxID=2209 RepID=A0A0F8MYN5_METMZ|nr:hypothetical protein [Methanosarcina mazei]KKH15832.1 hypothetical protein DU48_11960 [Methanosarcina mazei]KKH17148.1 hypothetical protein DU65_13030 [Methanosarcina mazei]KKH17349.1 hypothetical protein DU44_12775 [Methanosarcina mazei]